MGACLQAQPLTSEEIDKYDDDKPALPFSCCRSISIDGDKDANFNTDVIYLGKTSQSLNIDEKIEQIMKQYESLEDKQIRQEADKFIQFPLSYRKKQFDQGSGRHQKSGSIKLFALYEGIVSSLQDQILIRKESQEIYTQEELWYILFIMIKATQLNKSSRIQMGKIKPQVMSLNSNGELKIKFIPFDIENLENNQNYIRSPEESKENEILHSESVKIYRMGIILLVCGTLNDWRDLYDGKNIRRRLMSSLLEQFGCRYSSYLYSTLYSMLASNPEDRKSLSEILYKLKPYEKSINDMKRFLPDRKNSFSKDNSEAVKHLKIYTQ